MKIIDAICVTSSYVKRQQIAFNEVTHLIEEVGDLGIPRNKVDFYYGDDCLLFPAWGMFIFMLEKMLLERILIRKISHLLSRHA